MGLLIKMAINEATRSQLINKSKSGANYKDQSKGRNRWERRMRSNIASSVSQYNKISMDDFFKRDSLKLGVEVRGETDTYIVTIRVEGVLEEISKIVEQEDTSEVIKIFKEKYPKITVTNVYVASDSNGSKLGYVITLSTKEGHGDNITFSMGITNDRLLNGVSILSSNETVGLGLEADKVLVPQFNGKNVQFFTYTKTGSTSDSEIDAISSATITTNAFVNAVNAGLDYFDTNLANL